MKIAAVVVGLFVAGLAFLSYKGWVDVRWTAMEVATRSILANLTTQAIHTLNDTASVFGFKRWLKDDFGSESKYIDVIRQSCKNQFDYERVPHLGTRLL